MTLCYAVCCRKPNTLRHLRQLDLLHWNNDRWNCVAGLPLDSKKAQSSVTGCRPAELSVIVAICGARRNWPLCSQNTEIHVLSNCILHRPAQPTVCARLYVMSVSINNCLVFFLTNLRFYTLHTTFIQPSAAKLFLVKINHYYYEQLHLLPW